MSRSLIGLRGHTPRLGTNHFAHLRAVLEGVPIVEAARRYLVIDHGAEALKAHRLVLDQVRAVARRRGDSRWRLLGLAIPVATAHGVGEAPDMYAWAEAEGLGDWSEKELQLMHAERFALNASPQLRRRSARDARLRERRLALLRELEASAAEPAASTDLLAGWLPPQLAEALIVSGALTLGDLRVRVARGGRWWAGVPGFGPTKAKRLAALVELLLSAEQTPSGWPVTGAAGEVRRLARGVVGGNCIQGATAAVGTVARNDREAVQAWIAARAGSPLTAKQYEREAERFMLWCVLERGKAMSDATAEDCRAYMDFLAAIPERWISRRRVARFEPDWAPFKGQLKHDSQRVAIDALGSLFNWLVQARYLASTPWALVNRKLGDDAQTDDEPGSRAFTPAAWAALHAHLAAAAPSPSLARLRWICAFVQMVGLRSAELLRATRGHLKETSKGWVVRVHGKGRRNRTVPVPRAAIAATREYFASRGLSFEDAPPETWLLAALPGGGRFPRETADERPLSYPALYETFTRFVRRAISASSLAPAERGRALVATAHWLRHTYATRAAEKGVPADVLQENLGQSDPRTTARYYRAQMERRQEAMEKAFEG